MLYIKKTVIVAFLVLYIVEAGVASSYFDLTSRVETVYNIPWKYVTYNGSAVIFNTTMNDDRSRRYNSAIPNETSGNISVPSVLGGQKVVNVGSGAFFNCSLITRISLPMDVEEIGYWAFMGCEALREINIPEKVQEIRGASFHKCFKLRKVNIPSSVKYVSHHAFSQCYALREMLLPASLQRIGYSAFQCSGLEEMSVPKSVTNIGDCAFADCKSLRKIDLPPTIRTFGMRMFMQCDKLEQVKLPYGIDRIGELTFQGCSRLRLVSIPDGVKSIDEESFAGCASLKVIRLPDSVTHIGDRAFYGCSSLVSVSMPAGVVSIGNAAFKDCGNLKRVKFTGNAPFIPKGIPFSTNVVVEVLEGTKGWDDDLWRSFTIKVVPPKDPNGVSHRRVETVSFTDAYFTSLAFMNQRIKCRGILTKIKYCGPFILRPVEGELWDDEHIVHANNYQNIYIHRCNGDVKTCRCNEDDGYWQWLDGKTVIVEGVLSEPEPGCSMVSWGSSIAILNRHTPIQYNCQDYADDLRLEYDRLMKDSCERKKCGLK